MLSTESASRVVSRSLPPAGGRSEKLVPPAIGLVVAIAVVWPWVGRGWLLALDWTHGPASRLPPDFSYSVVSQPSVLFTWLVHLASQVFGIATTAWLTIAATFVVASYSASRLSPGGLTAKTVAATFYVVNPYVFERIYAGQIGVLAGYALLPLAARSLIDCESQIGRRRWSAAGWVALAGALDVHFIWILLAFLVGLVLWRHRLRTVAWAGGLLALLVVLDAYLLVPHFLQVTPVTAGSNALQAFQTLGDPRWGLYLNVAGLYGFWRIGPVLPKQYVPAWPALTLVFIGVSVFGLWRSRHSVAIRSVAWPVAVAAVIGFFLALGTQGPSGSIFHLLYRHIPGFAVMRESEKFSALLALGYAVCLGAGVEAILSSVASQRARVASTFAAAAVAVAYTPTLFGGLNGQIRLSHYPKDLAAAAKIVGSGPGRVLALPLHMYISFSFTGRRIIANPAPSLFDRQVLVGGDIGAGPLKSDSLSPENAYLQSLVADASSITDLGHLVAQLGVRYVVLMKSADYKAYGWLANQKDLKLIYDGRDVAVYLNPLALPTGARLTGSLTVPSISCYLGLAQTRNLVGFAAVQDRSASCRTNSLGAHSVPSDVSRSSSVTYDVKTGRAGYVVIPEPADGTWTAGGHQPVGLANGLQAFRIGPRAAEISLRRWWAPPLGDTVSALAFIALCVAALRSHRRSAVAGELKREDGMRRPDT